MRWQRGPGKDNFDENGEFGENSLIRFFADSSWREFLDVTEQWTD